MPSYEVNERAVEKAQQLIRDSKVDDNTDWADAIEQAANQLLE